MSILLVIQDSTTNMAVRDQYMAHAQWQYCFDLIPCTGTVVLSIVLVPHLILKQEIKEMENNQIYI